MKKYMKTITGKIGMMWKKLPSDQPAIFQMPESDETTVEYPKQ